MVIKLHDATIAARILETVKGYRNLRCVYVGVGKRSCIHDGMLRRSFDAAKRGTPACGAELEIVPCPGEGVTVLSVEVDDEHSSG